ncbi:hypothetical protein [Achromobacter kerstersii]
MTSSLRTDDSIWGAAALANDTRAAIKEDAKKEGAEKEAVIAADAKEKDDAAKTDMPSVRVSISGDALERAAKARKAKMAEAGQSAAAGPSGSDMARGRIAEIKQRIKMLKMLLAMMGPEAAKGIIQELRQLAGQLAQAAATLSQGSGGGASVGPMTAPVVHSATAAPSAAMPAAATAGITSAAAASTTEAPAAGLATTSAAAPQPQAEAPASNAVASNAVASNAVATNTAASNPASNAAASNAPASNAPASNTPASNTAASRALTAYAGGAATAEDRAADAAETASASGEDSERIDASSPADERQRDARQRQADERLVKEVMQELKALLAAAEKALREDKNADGNRVAELKDKLAQAEQSARSRDADGIGSPADDAKPLSARPDRKATKEA